MMGLTLLGVVAALGAAIGYAVRAAQRPRSITESDPWKTR